MSWGWWPRISRLKASGYPMNCALRASLHPIIDAVKCIGCGSCVKACPVQPEHAVLGLLGGKRWAALHRSIYVIVILGTIHFWMAVKRDITDPLIYALIFAVLLGYRVAAWRRRRAAAAIRAANAQPAPRRATA